MLTYDAADRAAIRAHAARLRAASARLVAPAARAQGVSQQVRRAVTERRVVWQSWHAPVTSAGRIHPAALDAAESLGAILAELGGDPSAGDSIAGAALSGPALDDAVLRAVRALAADEMRMLAHDLRCLGHLLRAESSPPPASSLPMPSEPVPSPPSRRGNRLRPPLRP